MTTQVTADQLENEFGISQESISALAQASAGKGFRIAGPEGSTINVKPNGRPASFGAFAWDGTPTQVPIAYDPGGTNPRIDRYLRKRHCNGCGRNGFITNDCPHCHSVDTIRWLYTRFEDVPFKRAVRGGIVCLCSQDGPIPSSPICPRRGTNGFLSQFQMMQHAVSKHPQEYRLWRDMQHADATGTGSTNADIKLLMDEIAALKARLDTPQPVGQVALQETIDSWTGATPDTTEEVFTNVIRKPCSKCDFVAVAETEGSAAAKLGQHKRYQHPKKKR